MAAKEGAKSKKNTSKTARVLGLLTSPPPTEEPLEDAPSGARARKPATPKPSDDTVVESQVRSALETELENLLPSFDEPEPQLEDQPAPPEGPMEDVLDEPIPDELVPEDLGPADLSPEPLEPPVPEPAPAPPSGASRSVAMKSKPDLSDRDERQDEEEFFCFNVMQALVEAKTEKYIKLFGLCGCSRCHTDVVALALTNLPAKYVVASNREMVPLLSVYEGTYSAAVISQVMNACKRVMAHPRHKV